MKRKPGRPPIKCDFSDRYAARIYAARRAAIPKREGRPNGLNVTLRRRTTSARLNVALLAAKAAALREQKPGIARREALRQVLAKELHRIGAVESAEYLLPTAIRAVNRLPGKF